MLSRWPIRYKLIFGVLMLLLIVALLSFTGFRGVYSFRKLTKSIRVRASELPLAAEVTERTSELRGILRRPRHSADISQEWVVPGIDWMAMREEFRSGFVAVSDALERYKNQLHWSRMVDPRIADNRRERETVREMEQLLVQVDVTYHQGDWVLDYSRTVTKLDEQLEALQQLASRLPGYLKQRMDNFAVEARSQYRAWIVLTWIAGLTATGILLLLVKHYYGWIFRPLRMLIHASRRVAQGDFDHRIQLNTKDEMSELAGAMNAMTSRFKEVRDDLDRQVDERTRQVVRSEQLASVGFLAAGVAHEINNPLASIAWAAESLELRLHDIIHHDDELPDGEQDEEIRVLRKYLCRIQDEAFRCKGITERLLDYSRLGNSERVRTELGELVDGVIEMVRDLGRYRDKKIIFECGEPVIADVDPQEIKQVVLNLVTNGLDSLEPNGTVTVRLSKTESTAELVVADSGCGMTQEVLDHLFEPFFTQRRDGQGTGLGMSITYRIVTEHGGNIEARSDGPNCGSTISVSLPLVKHEQKSKERQLQVA